MPSGNKGKRRKHYDKIGQRYHRLVVIADAGSAVGSSGEILGTNWLCQCDCGQQHLVLNKLLGKVKSCGCLQTETRKTCQKRALQAAALAKAENTDWFDSAIRIKFRGYQQRSRIKESRKRIRWFLTLDNCRQLFAAPCKYCGKPAENKGKATKSCDLSGLDRIDPAGHYTLDNVVPCCKHCNYAKNDMSVDQFKEWISKVHSHLNK